MTGSKMKRNQICKTRTTHWNFIIRLIRNRWISKNLSFQTFTNRVFNKNRERRFTLELRPWRLDWRRVISYKMGLSKSFYSPKGFWKGLEAVKMLAQEAGVSEDVAKLWLMKQAIWQIYLPVPKNIEFWCDISKFSSSSWSSFPPSWSTSVRKEALTCIDGGRCCQQFQSRWTTHFQRVFASCKRPFRDKGPLRWPLVLQVDPGRVLIHGWCKERDGEAWCQDQNWECERSPWSRNPALNDSIENWVNGFSVFNSSQEMNMKSSERSRVWVKRLPDVVKALNIEVTRLTRKKPVDAIRERPLLMHTVQLFNPG